MAIINSRGVLGIKWLYIILGAVGFIFRHKIMEFAKPWIEKVKKATETKTPVA